MTEGKEPKRRHPLEIKNGCADGSHDNSLSISEENLQKLVKALRINTSPIVLPICNNQSELYFEMRKFIDKKTKEEIEEDITRKPVICDGYLPIRSIKIAPMIDRKRIVEQVKRFCQSKYWLMDVEVSHPIFPMCRVLTVDEYHLLANPNHVPQMG
jgi:hypothetical protein